MRTVTPSSQSRPSPRLRPFSASLPMLLMRAREAVMVEFRAMLRDQGLSEQQWRVLRALDAMGTAEVTRLAEATFLLGPSLSRILPELDRRGLIRIEIDAVDQRRKLVRLAPAGSDLIDVVAPLSEAIYARIEDRVGAERLAQLQSLLVDVEASLGRP